MPRQNLNEDGSPIDEEQDRSGSESSGIIGGLLRALFPPRRSVEKAKDGAFNTTIGMLAMF